MSIKIGVGNSTKLSPITGNSGSEWILKHCSQRPSGRMRALQAAARIKRQPFPFKVALPVDPC